ncbi:hypothetical protein [Micromonospora sp. NPDC023633]|uniref:hypothetical protein n=1 Tax=Micromonospora sp. NPDC023633 TaxID=3154320 RepID=UPI0033C054EB
MAVGDLDRDRIIAAYADGQDVASIGREYGVSSDDIERIVAETDPVAAEPAAPSRRAPAAIVAAALIVVLYGLVQLVSAASHPAYNGAAFRAAVVVVGGALYTFIALGIWKGWRAAQWFGAVGGALAVVAGASADGGPDLLGVVGGALFVGLLIVPESSRDWFARR